MGYAIALIALLLVFLVLHYFTELDTKQKSLVTALLLAVVALAFVYNNISDQKQSKILDVANRFNQGEKLICDGVEVSSEHFGLSVGTYTFIGKKDSPHSGVMISASKCD
ncbi:MAG: hypothetical protein WCR69_03880 [Sulfuricurvum sp.]